MNSEAEKEEEVGQNDVTSCDCSTADGTVTQRGAARESREHNNMLTQLVTRNVIPELRPSKHKSVFAANNGAGQAGAGEANEKVVGPVSSLRNATQHPTDIRCETPSAD